MQTRYTGKVTTLSTHVDDEDARLVPLLKRNEYHDGLPDGTGKLVFPDRSEYVGDLYRGRIHGEGKYTTPDGQVWEGTFVNGELHGSWGVTPIHCASAGLALDCAA